MVRAVQRKAAHIGWVPQGRAAAQMWEANSKAIAGAGSVEKLLQAHSHFEAILGRSIYEPGLEVVLPCRT